MNDHTPMYLREEPQVFDDDGLELMGSHLMGGAPLPPLSPQQRQQYIEGVTLRAKV